MLFYDLCLAKFVKIETIKNVLKPLRYLLVPFLTVLGVKQTLFRRRTDTTVSARRTAKCASRQNKLF